MTCRGTPNKAPASASRLPTWATPLSPTIIHWAPSFANSAAVQPATTTMATKSPSHQRQRNLWNVSVLRSSLDREHGDRGVIMGFQDWPAAPHSKPMRCDQCRKSFGLILHRYYRMRFCSADCLEAYQRRLDDLTITRIQHLGAKGGVDDAIQRDCRRS